MRSSVILAVVCGALLVGAWLLSRALLSDVEAPVSTVSEAQAPARTQTPSRLEPSVTQQRALEVRRPLPENLELPVARRELPPAPIPAAVPMPTAVADAGLAEADPAPDPYVGDSRELDYADSLLADPTANRERVLSARDAYQRCLEAHPGDERCTAGLYDANTRLKFVGSPKAMRGELRPAKPIARDRIIR